MSRAFFDQVEDELRGLLGPSLRDYQSLKTSRLIKIWFENPDFHFEAQSLSPRWSPTKGSSYEVGLHLESSDSKKNDGLLSMIQRHERQWKKQIPNAEMGKALGPRASVWRRVSEVAPAGPEDDPDIAGEMAERISSYMKALKGIVDRWLTESQYDPRLGSE